MIKLKYSTWYYLYLDDNGELLLSDEAPIKENEKSRDWYHADKGYKCITKPIFIQSKASQNVMEFFDD